MKTNDFKTDRYSKETVTYFTHDRISVILTKGNRGIESSPYLPRLKLLYKELIPLED